MSCIWLHKAMRPDHAQTPGPTEPYGVSFDHANHTLRPQMTSVRTRARWSPLGVHRALHTMHPDYTQNPSPMEPHDPKPYGAPWRSMWPRKTYTQNTVKP